MFWVVPFVALVVHWPRLLNDRIVPVRSGLPASTSPPVLWLTRTARSLRCLHCSSGAFQLSSSKGRAFPERRVFGA